MFAKRPCNSQRRPRWFNASAPDATRRSTARAVASLVMDTTGKSESAVSACPAASVPVAGGEFTVTAGSLMQRVLYHYWYHTGENMAIRQMLGNPNLPDFVGNIDEEAPYAPH